MSKAYYSSTIKDFLCASEQAIFGAILIKDEFRSTIEQRYAWQKEIEILKKPSKYLMI